jgi:hypothetical protein
LVLKMQRVGFLGRNENVTVLEEKAILRRNVFTMEGNGKGNGVPCITEDDREQEEVMKLKDIINEWWLPVH